MQQKTIQSAGVVADAFYTHSSEFADFVDIAGGVLSEKTNSYLNNIAPDSIYFFYKNLTLIKQLMWGVV